MARMHSGSIIAIGDAGHPEFRGVSAWLRDCDAHVYDACEDALAFTAVKPHTIFLLAEHRGAFAQPDIERLHRAAPLARLVMVCGSWCEGETRSGLALSGVTRVYWHQFMPRASASLRVADDYAGWSLPRTSTAIDMSLHGARRLRPLSGGRVGILAETLSDFLSLADAVQACGVGAVRFHAGNGARYDAVLWCGRSLDEASLERLQAVVTKSAPFPVIALLDFPRADEVSAVIGCGAAAVLGKPFLLGDLAMVLGWLSQTDAPSETRQAG